MNETHDAIVIGSGQGGKPLSLALAASGRRTALIERAFVGGTCINVGCTPTKTMVASARVAWLARRGGEYGVGTGPVRVAQDEVRRRKQAVVESFRSGSRKRLEEAANLDLLFGEAVLEGPGAVAVRMREGAPRRLAAREIFINTGCRPLVPPLDGLGGVPFLDSSTVMELEEVPEHLVVLGGGYIGVEFGQMFARFGSRVTVIQRAAQLLGREDPDIAEAAASILREDGLEVLLETEAAGVRPGRNGGVVLAVTGPEGRREIEASHLLVATGRRPNTDGLGLEAAGVETDGKGFIRVNGRLETSAPGVWAIGDVKGGPAFTHISYDDFRILKTNLLDGGTATTGGRLVPYTVYMDPQLGRVGLSEREAREKSLSVRVAKMPMTHVARAIEMGETRGLMKAVVDRDSGRILGFAALGVEGGELMSMVEIAMMGGVAWPALRDGIFAHPTLAESLNNLFGSLGD